MNNFVLKQKVLTDILCKDIIEIFEETDDIIELDIPKYSTKWEKIELNLYKELLKFIYKYKNNLITNNLQKDERKNTLIQHLNKNLYIKKFTIRKIINNTSEPLDITPPINNFNRYNLLKYMFCLNEKSVEMFIDNDNIISDCGDLLLFPNDVSYKISARKLSNNLIMMFTSFI
jgi:hypothetical protein